MNVAGLAYPQHPELAWLWQHPEPAWLWQHPEPAWLWQHAEVERPGWEPGRLSGEGSLITGSTPEPPNQRSAFRSAAPLGLIWGQWAVLG